MKKIIVAYSPTMSLNDIVRVEVEAGASISEIVAGFDGLPEDFDRFGAVFINGEVVERQMWDLVKPKDGGDVPVVVVLVYTPKGFVKDAFNAVVNFVGDVVDSVVDFIRDPLGIKALEKKLKEEKLSSGNRGNVSSLEGNTLQKGSSIPRVIGTYKVFPPFLINPLTSNVEDNQYTEAVMCLAGPHKIENIKAGDVSVLSTDDIAVEVKNGWYVDDALLVTNRGNRSILLTPPAAPATGDYYRNTVYGAANAGFGNFGGVIVNIGTIFVWSGAELLLHEEDIGIVERQSFTSTDRIECSTFQFEAGSYTTLSEPIDPELALPSWEVVGSRKSPDEFWIHLNFPQGVYQQAAPTATTIVPIRIQFRQAGSNTWINCPEIWVAQKTADPMRKSIYFYWRDEPIKPVPPDSLGFIYAYCVTRPQTVAPVPLPNIGAAASVSGQNRWIADQYFRRTVAAAPAFNSTHIYHSTNAATSDVIYTHLTRYDVSFYLDETVFPKGVYEFRIKRGLAHNSTVIDKTQALPYVLLSGQSYDPFYYYKDSASANAIGSVIHRALEFQNGNFILGSAEGTIRTSTDAQNYTVVRQTLTTDAAAQRGAVTRAIWDGARYVAFMQVSTTPAITPGASYTYTSGASYLTAQVIRSYDTATATTATNQTVANIRDVAWNGNAATPKYLVVGETTVATTGAATGRNYCMYISSDVTNPVWRRVSSPLTSVWRWYSCGYGGAAPVFVVSGTNGTMHWSTGVPTATTLQTETWTWTACTINGAAPATFLGATGGLLRIIWTGSRFVAVGDKVTAPTFTYLTSLDGKAWTSSAATVTLPAGYTSFGAVDVIVDPAGFVLMAGVFRTSAGVVTPAVVRSTAPNFTSNLVAVYHETALTGNTLGRIAVNSTGTAYAAAGTNGLVAYSADGITWSNLGAKNRVAFSQENVSSRVVIERSCSVWNEKPVPTGSGLTIIGIKVRNRDFPSVSCDASGYVKDWDGTGWNRWTTTSNPAPHFYDVMAGSLNLDPVPTSIISNTDLVAWRTRCNSHVPPYQFNGIIENASALDAMSLISSAGFAVPYHSEIWSVAEDRDRSAEVPVQVFTPRNSRNFTFSKAFEKPTDALRVSYFEKSDGYLQTEFIRYDDLVNGPNLLNPRLEAFDARGTVTLTEAERLADYVLKAEKLRSTIYTLEADIEALVCRKNDLVAVQSDILSTVSGSSRIRAKTVVGANITAITLWEAIPLGAGPNSVSIRSLAGGIVTRAITQTNTTTATLTFSVPLANTADIDTDCLIMAGPSTTQYLRLIVTSIQPGPGYTYRLTLKDEAPALINFIT